MSKSLLVIDTPERLPIKKSDFDKYGCSANSWVFVIEFNKNDKLEDEKNAKKNK